MPAPATAILLAAGSSSRMGRTKQLLPLNGKPVIRHCLDAILGSGIESPVVVLGPESEKIQEVIQDLSLTIDFNIRRDSEMADSVRVGLRSVDDSYSGVFICLADHPMVSAETYETLLKHHIRNPDQILIPTYKEKRGHPTLFPLSVLKEVFSGINLRAIIDNNEDQVKLTSVADEGVVLDLDTGQDYRKIRECYERGHFPTGSVPNDYCKAKH